jgi:hypothetical protein
MDCGCNGSIPQCSKNFMSDLKKARDQSSVQPVWDRTQPACDEAKSPGTSGRLSGITGVDWIFFSAIAAVAFGVGIVNALSEAQDVARRGGVYDVGAPLLWEMTSVVTIILVAPVLFVAVRRMRNVSGWPLRVGLALASIFVFSTLHIAGMVGLRKFALFLVGGSYDFHFSLPTLIYEFRKDVITCLLIGGAVWLIDRRGEAEQSRSAEATATVTQPSAPHMVWLRDGSTRIRIEPGDVLWINSAGNYVEYRLADGVTHLVRGTLAAEEARLTHFNIVRVHRTRLVNLAHVSELRVGSNGDFELTLDTRQTISGSRRYRAAVASIESLADNGGPGPNPHERQA